MADRIEENTDVAVSEFRRKARRRLLGAIVLALGAAILLPLLLETEPRPLGDDVSIQIPPVDNGKFVSRLSPDKAKEAKPDINAAPKSGEAPAPISPAAPAPTPASNAPNGGAAANAPPATTASAPPPATAPEPATRPITPAPKAVADAGALAEATSKATPAATDSPTAPEPVPAAAPAAVTLAGATDTNASAAAPAADAPRKPEGFIIQLAAFTDDKGANAFANKMKKLGYPAYTEPVQTNRGKLWRVRVGGYPTRAAANDALANLKAAGHNGLVSAVK